MNVKDVLNAMIATAMEDLCRDGMVTMNKVFLSVYRQGLVEIRRLSTIPPRSRGISSAFSFNRLLGH